MFIRSPHDVYYDIYQLVRHIGFSAEYVENMSPAEREVYKSYYIMDNEDSVYTDENKQAAEGLGLNIEDLI